MAPKRKADPKQPSLEETVEKPVTKVRTKGTKKETKQVGDHDDLVRAKLARKHGNGNLPLGFPLGTFLCYMHLKIPPSTLLLQILPSRKRKKRLQQPKLGSLSQSLEMRGLALLT